MEAQGAHQAWPEPLLDQPTEGEGDRVEGKGERADPNLP